MSALLLAIEVLVAGAFSVWLFTAVPAAVITVLKGQLRMFGWGFVTFGAIWFLGAFSLAPADSGWARRRYSEEQRGRAGLPFSKQRSRQTYRWWIVGVSALVVLAGAFALRPAPILGVGGRSLGDSLPHRGGGFFGFPALGPCENQGGDVWSCAVYDAERSGDTLTYEVKVNGVGCWTAHPTQNGYDWGKLSGCISVLSYL